MAAFIFCLNGNCLAQTETTAKDEKESMHHKHGYHRSFSDLEESLKRFEDPSRETWQKPFEVIHALKINATDTIADVGAGTGYFSLRIAKAYPGCIVYGADVEPVMISYMQEQSKKLHLPNHKAVLIPSNKLKLPGKLDLVLVVDTYHHLDDRIDYFEKMKKILRPSARVAIIDFTLESPEGPPADHRITKEDLEKEMKHAGFALAEDIKLLPYQYFLVFTPEKY
jgi:SAM-dependent methyltransferase